MEQECKRVYVTGCDRAIHVGFERVWEGLSGFGRVWEGCFFFFWPLFSLHFCIGFSVSGFSSRCWQPLHDSHRRQTRAGQLPVGGQGVVSGRLMSCQAGLGRVRAGSLPFFLDICAWLRIRFLAVFVGYWAAFSLATAFLHLRMPCQRALWLDDDSTFPVMPFHISAQCYSVTAIISLKLMHLP